MIVKTNSRYTRMVKRRRSTWQTKLCKVVYTLLFINSSICGILLGTLVVSLIWPNHPLYVAIREFLKNLLGVN